MLRRRPEAARFAKKTTRKAAMKNTARKNSFDGAVLVIPLLLGS
jgi:hypothetical protein